MLTQLKRLFGRGNPPAKRRTDTATPSHAGFRPPAARATTETRHSESPASPANQPGQIPDVGDEDVSIPLQSVLNALPPDLKSHVLPMDLQGATLTVALHKILSQLPSGVVTLSFGVLRGAAPQLFTVGEECDQRDIELPLNELLVRIPPALLRPTPKQKAAQNTDTLQASLPTQAVPSRSPQPAAPRTTQAPIRVPLPATTPVSPAPTTTTAAPSTNAAKPPAPTPAREAIVVPLDALAAAWPVEVRKEIAQLKCQGAQVALPEQLVKARMKQGKVAFPWQAIRGWINPAPPVVLSKHDSTILNLPLEVIMPVFVSRLKQSPKTQPRLVVDESIPALFGPATTPEAPAAEANHSLTNSAATTNAPGAAPKTPSTDFKNRYISPAQAVTRASALDGVAGALVVLPEGLLVAAQVPTDQNPDALAAFLAQAFGRVSLCASEAQIGEISHLEFTAQTVPWRIFRLHGVLLAVFGHAGGSLPTPQLVGLAGEFDRKK